MTALEYAINLTTRFQTALVGAIGFGGVILTLLTNARLAREGREATKTHDRETLATGLSVELQVYLKGLEGNLPKLQSPRPEIDLNFPIYNMSKIFEANLDKIGLLDSVTLRLVLDSYMGIEQWKNVLLIVGELVNDGRSVRVKGAFIAKLLPGYESLLGDIRNAVKALDAITSR